MNKYLEYKESGIEWIGEIPSHWCISPLKYIVSYNDEVLSGDTNPEQEFWYIEIGDVNQYAGVGTGRKVTFSEAPSSARRILQKDDVLISTVRTYLKAIGTVTEMGQKLVGSTGFCVLRPTKRIYSSFLSYFLVSGQFISSVVSNSDGVAYPTITPPTLVRLSALLPPITEQIEISRYLDKKTSQIDSLIEKLERKIELLKEQRTSLINQCVTKGIGQNVEMKDSEIEWIGQIPKHWELKKLKYIFDIETGRAPGKIYSDEGQYDVLGTGGVIGRTDQFMYDQQSLILGRKGTIDRPFIQDTPFWISDVAYYTKPRLFVTPKYLLYLFSQIDFSFYKYGSTLPSMSKEDYKNMIFPVPPESELIRIDQYLKDVLMSLSVTQIKHNRKIELLKEYRQSLISAVVTGKVRVTLGMI